MSQGVPLAQSCWRVVEARVHISLTPQELSTNARQAATRSAFQSLLMRYSPALKGVVVAHRGGLRLNKSAFLVGTSPYAHLNATATLLVFAPPPGAELVGIVKHVGPDHVALSVLGTFHAVLPLHPLREFYAYDFRVADGLLVRRWRVVGNAPDFVDEITINRQVRFVVEGVKPARSGLFQILASLNDSFRTGPADGRPPLGVIAHAEELEMSVTQRSMLGVSPFRNAQVTIEESDEEVAPTPPINVLATGRRSSASRDRDSLLGSNALAGNPFGDALMVTPGSGQAIESKKKKKKKKKRKEGGGNSAKKSVTFEGIGESAKEEPEHILMDVDIAEPVLTQPEFSTPVYPSLRQKSGEKGSRKLNSTEKKKKKKKSKYRDRGKEEEGQLEKHKKKKAKKERAGESTSAGHAEKEARRHHGGVKRSTDLRKERQKMLGNEKEENRLSEEVTDGRDRSQVDHVRLGVAHNEQGTVGEVVRNDRQHAMLADAQRAVAVGRTANMLVKDEIGTLETTPRSIEHRGVSAVTNGHSLSPRSDKSRHKKKRKRTSEKGTDEEARRKKKKKKRDKMAKKEDAVVE